MKKIYTSLLLLVSSLLSFCQGEPSDYFKKYSYQLIYVPGKFDSLNKMARGTGFFIRKNNRLFLATALHVVTGCSYDSMKRQNPQGSLSVVLQDGKNIQGVYGVDIRKYALTQCVEIDNSIPDLALLEINSLYFQNVFSIEEFIRPNFKFVSSATIYGFGTDSTNLIVNTPSIDFETDKETFIRGLRRDSIPDTLNYYVRNKKYDKDIHGFSGSPLFVKEKGSGIWRIAGVLIGGFPFRKKVKNYLIVCRIENLWSMLPS